MISFLKQRVGRNVYVIFQDIIQKKTQNIVTPCTLGAVLAFMGGC